MDDIRMIGRSAASAAEPLALGVLVAARGPAPSGPREALGEFLALYAPLGEGGALLADPFAAPDAATGDGIMLLAPRRVFSGLLPEGATAVRLDRSVGLQVLKRYTDGLLALAPDRLCARQAKLAGGAVRALLDAARPSAETEHGLGSRRRASLLDRVVAYIDGHLDAAHSAGSLGAALGCSRSALYRATGDAGGVAGLVQRRRLIAVHARLRDPAEARPITEIARACGFADATHFNRRFKAMFGATPGETRRGPLVRRRDPRPSSSLRRRLACG